MADKCVCFLFMGRTDPFMWRYADEKAEEIATDMASHLAQHGMKGWRRWGNLAINISEVQAFWVQDVPSEPDAPGATP